MTPAGKVGGLYGARGQRGEVSLKSERVGGQRGEQDGGVALTLYDSFPRDFNIDEEPVWVFFDSLPVPLFFEFLSFRGTRGATACFADIDTPSRAAELVGLEFFLKSDTPAAPAPSDFIGWTVDLGAEITGVISDFIDGPNPLFEIALTPASPPAKTSALTPTTVLIPASPDFISSIDEPARSITFSLPEGLLDLNSSQRPQTSQTLV